MAKALLIGGAVLGAIALAGVASAGQKETKKDTSKNLGGGELGGDKTAPLPLGQGDGTKKIYTPADLPQIMPFPWTRGIVKGSALHPQYVQEFYNLDPLDIYAKTMLLDFLALKPEPGGQGSAQYVSDCKKLKVWADAHAPRLSQLLALTIFEQGGTPAISPYTTSQLPFDCEQLDSYGGTLPVLLRVWASSAWVLCYPGESAAIDACIKSRKYEPFPHLQASLLARAVELRGLANAAPTKRQNTSPTPPFVENGGKGSAPSRPSPAKPTRPAPVEIDDEDNDEDEDEDEKKPPRDGGDEKSKGPGARKPARPQPRQPPKPGPTPGPSPAPQYNAPSRSHARVSFKGPEAYWQVREGDIGFSNIASKLGYGDRWRELRDANPSSYDAQSRIKGAPLLRIPKSWGYDKTVKTGPAPSPVPAPDFDEENGAPDGGKATPTPGVPYTNDKGEIVIPGTNVPPGMPTGIPGTAPVGQPAPAGLKPGVVWDPTTSSAYYTVKQGDGGLSQIATKIGPPGAAWRDLRDANMSIFSNRSANDVRGGDRLKLPDAWVAQTSGFDPDIF